MRSDRWYKKSSHGPLVVNFLCREYAWVGSLTSFKLNSNSKSYTELRTKCQCHRRSNEKLRYRSTKKEIECSWGNDVFYFLRWLLCLFWQLISSVTSFFKFEKSGVSEYPILFRLLKCSVINFTGSTPVIFYEIETPVRNWRFLCFVCGCKLIFKKVGIKIYFERYWRFKCL